MAELYEHLRALELELKIRELHQRERWEARKVSALLARVIITNLIWMNGAAASSVPVIASFMGIGSLPWQEKLALLLWPSAAFAFGLTCALLCAIIAYLAYLRTSDLADNERDAEVAAFREAHPTYASSLALKPQDGDNTERLRGSLCAIRWASFASQLLGWLSLAALLTGWFWILEVEAPHAPLR
jgi:hypothetical protein